MRRRLDGSLVLRILGRLLFGTKAGRRLLGGGIAVASVCALVSDDTKERTGTWKGLDNHIAPRQGPITVKGNPGESATCTVRGKTKGASGSQWVFKGDAWVKESSCEGRIDKDGNVSLALTLVMSWHGKEKGLGGDWGDTSGSHTCEGELKGSLAQGGEWKGKCKNEDREWETSIEWQLDD